MCTRIGARTASFGNLSYCDWTVKYLVQEHLIFDCVLMRDGFAWAGLGPQAATVMSEQGFKRALRSGRIFFLFHIKLFDSGASFFPLQISRIKALMQREVRVQLRQADLQTLNTQSSRSRGRRGEKGEGSRRAISQRG